MHPSFTITVPLQQWAGTASWYYVLLPKAIASQIREMAMHGGFGSVKVQVVCGKTTWKTSLFRDTERESYILFIKKAVRQSENLNLSAKASYVISLV